MKTSCLKVSPEMLRLIGEVDEFKGGWRTLTTLAPEMDSKINSLFASS